MAEKVKINRLKSVLADKDLRHKDFAKMVKKTPNTITRICNNDHQPSLKLLRDMAIALDVDMCELLAPIKRKK
jgi:transcriptional regulator with XRE-family HTH domain